MNQVLEIDGLAKGFSLHHLGTEIGAFEDISFDVAAGEFVLLKGANGAGKSTLLRTLYRSYLPRAGAIRFHSSHGVIDLARAADVDVAHLRRTEIGFVTQFLTARPRVSAEASVAEPLRLAGWDAFEALEKARTALATFGVKHDLWAAYPTTFSGGEQQKVNLARALTTAYAGVSFSRTAKDGERRSFEHTSSIIRALKENIQGLRVDHRIHARFDMTYTAAIDALEGLLADGAVDLVSVMDHTPGQGQYRNVEKLIAHRVNGGLSEAEARAYIDRRIQDALDPAQVLANLQRISTLCVARGVAVASHDDDTVEKTRLMADIGAVISEFPVTLEAAKTAAERGLMIAMGAPNAMRGQSNFAGQAGGAGECGWGRPRSGDPRRRASCSQHGGIPLAGRIHGKPGLRCRVTVVSNSSECHGTRS